MLYIKAATILQAVLVSKFQALVYDILPARKKSAGK